ncbi:3'-5' exonuclease [Bifidobacterium pseudocatenulatum]|uniref:3'-5' exonuclease n=1 Tax=Bifidobacterium pseudocatenulatum TaxID=28026 RepID=UPI000E434BD8|nr:3'-5' exonuclease [Bifidobacterium pseudocatenulatum]RGL09033.1 3'-5' exonuclease [Bifidobacterium pseudocatenulatum]
MTLVIVIVAVAAIAYAVSKKDKGQSSVPVESGLSGESHAGDDGLDSFAEFRMNAAIADAVVIDTETINSPSGTRVIDIGAILIRNNVPTCEWEQLISPECDLPASATLLTGITEESLLSQPNAEQVIPEFLAAISNLTLIGHNISYDVSALNKEASRLGIDCLDTTCIDTMSLAMAKFPNAPSASLQETMRLLGMQATEEHRALSDARWTLECWRRLEVMYTPRTLTQTERDESKRRALRDRRRKDSFFMKSAYLGGEMPSAVNAKPDGVMIETIECGVEISGDEDHQRILKRYGYDAWIWVYVMEDRIRKGKYAGYPTYWVFLDGEEIGYISKYQMERHCGQVPPEGAVMLAHVPDRVKDKDRHIWQLRLQMPGEHDPMELTRQGMESPKTEKPRKPKPVTPSPKKQFSNVKSVMFSNAKPHKKVLTPIGRTVRIEPVDGLDEILDQFEDQSHVWVTVKPSADVLVIRLSGTVLGTVALPTNTDPFGSETKVTSATIEKSDGQVKVSVDLPSDDDAGSR